MELKRRIYSEPRRTGLLLIVPYGIETSTMLCHSVLSGLLIVPYGIETLQEEIDRKYGWLLIVPYGIETARRSPHLLLVYYAFNRTLWN